MSSQLSRDLDVVCQEISMGTIWTWGKGIKCYGEKVHHFILSGAGKQSCDIPLSWRVGLCVHGYAKLSIALFEHVFVSMYDTNQEKVLSFFSLV